MDLDYNGTPGAVFIDVSDNIGGGGSIKAKGPNAWQSSSVPDDFAQDPTRSLHFAGPLLKAEEGVDDADFKLTAKLLVEGDDSSGGAKSVNSNVIQFSGEHFHATQNGATFFAEVGANKTFLDGRPAVLITDDDGNGMWAPRPKRSDFESLPSEIKKVALCFNLDDDKVAWVPVGEDCAGEYKDPVSASPATSTDSSVS
mgnify:FL=1